MRVSEDMVIYPPKYSVCPDCFENLDWDGHNANDKNIDLLYWTAYCKCNKNQRMWRMYIDTVKINSING